MSDAPTPPPDPASSPGDPPERDIVAEYRARERDLQEASQWHRLAGSGFEFAIAIVLMGAMGWGIDYLLGTLPWGLVLGLVAGFVLGLFLLIRTGMKSFK